MKAVSSEYLSGRSRKDLVEPMSNLGRPAKIRPTNIGRCPLDFREGSPERRSLLVVPNHTSSGDIWVIVSSGCFIDLGEEVVEELGSSGLAVFGGMVSLSEEDGLEGFVGGEVGAFFADGFEAAVELDGSGAESVAEEAMVDFIAEASHVRPFSRCW